MEVIMNRVESEIEKRPNAGIEKDQKWSRRTYSPNVDILETKDDLLLVADMPGVKSDSVDIHFENGELYLHGHVGDRQPGDQRYLLREYGVGDFYRVFQISEQIDAEKITAEYHAGVLTVRLPKVEAVKPRKILVKPR